MDIGPSIREEVTSNGPALACWPSTSWQEQGHASPPSFTHNLIPYYNLGSVGLEVEVIGPVANTVDTITFSFPSYHGSRGQ